MKRELFTTTLAILAGQWSEAQLVTYSTDCTFETQGTEQLTNTTSSPFGWRVITYNSTLAGARTVHRNNCPVGTTYPGQGGFNTNENTAPSINALARHGESWEFWQEPFAATGCLSNNKYLWLFLRTPDPATGPCKVRVVHQMNEPLGDDANFIDRAVWRGPYGWKRRSLNAPVTTFNVRFGLLPVGVPDNAPGLTDALPATATTFADNRMTWASSVIGATASAICDRLYIEFELTGVPAGHDYNFYLDDMLFTYNAFPLSGMQEQHSGPGALKSLVAGAASFAVIPNPTNGKVDLAIDRFDPATSMVQVLDALGRVSFEQRITDAARPGIDLSGFGPGLYIIRFFDGSNWREERVVKE